MNGRVYDPTLGRFLSVDPVFQFPTNGQSLNPYSYVLNNPLSSTDPSGYSTCSPAGNGTNNGAACEQVSLNPMTGSHIGGVNTGASCSGNCAAFAMNAISGQLGKAQQALGSIGLSLGNLGNQYVGIANGSTGQNDADKPGTSQTDLHGPQQVTASGAASSGDSGVAAPSHDVKRTSESDTWALKNASLLPSPSGPDELTLVNTAQTGLWYVTDGCYNAGCNVQSKDFIGTPEDILHSHQFSLLPQLSARLDETFQRELPGPGDWKTVAAYGAVNYFRAPSGIVRAVEYYGSAYHVSTVTPGAPDAFGQSKWMPNQPTNPLSPLQQGIVWRATRDESQDFNRLWQEGVPH